MRIAFKSLIVLHRSEWTCVDTTTTRTTYDMNSVQNHTVDIGWWSLMFHPQTLWRLAVGIAIPFALILIWAEGRPLPLFLGMLPFLLLFWTLSFVTAKQILLEEHARQERELPADTKIAVVEQNRWAVFVSELKQPSHFDDLLVRSNLTLQALRRLREQSQHKQD